VPCFACYDKPGGLSKRRTLSISDTRHVQRTAHYTVGAMRVIPPMYGTSASGTRTDPSAC
jgi:hypothetical protein